MALAIPHFKPTPCSECGMEGVHHSAERYSLLLASILRPATGIADALISFFTPILDRFLNAAGPLFFDLLAASGLATILPRPDQYSSETSLALWKEAERRGMDMREVRILGLPRNLFTARYKNKNWTFDGLPRPARSQHSIRWIDDKSEVKRRFERAGFPVAKGGLARTEAQAVRIFRKLSPPVITKPHEGSNGRHVTVHIETEEGLRSGFWNARKVSPFVVVEEELQGPVFRATLIDRKLVAILRRDPPQVTGDGKKTVAELVLEENKNVLRKGPVFAPIDIQSPTSEHELQRQGLTKDSVPKSGQKVLFHFKVNWGVGGTSRDATEETHPDNIKLFEDIGAYLRDDIVGIDFMSPDIKRSWKTTERCGVIELNSLPLIGNHHFPYEGRVVNVAGAIWDMVFPGSGSK